MKKILVLSLSVAALSGCETMDKTMDSMMGVTVKAPLIACPTKTPIGDVPSCGKIWKLGSGTAELKKDGNLNVSVKGLVLNDESVGKYNGTPDGVDGVAAAVICGGKVAAQTDVVPLSQAGDATVSAKVTVPESCTTPIIALRERYEGKVGGWLAATATK